jgi:hypothetical protein
MRRILITSNIILAVLVSGCYYDKFNELHPLDGYVDTCADSLTDNYTSVVKNIMQLNCVSCHNSSVHQGGVTLSSYDDVKHYVSNGKLMGTIEHQTYIAMPPNSSLRDCDVNQLKKWIANDMPQ